MQLYFEEYIEGTVILPITYRFPRCMLEPIIRRVGFDGSDLKAIRELRFPYIHEGMANLIRIEGG